MNYDDEPAFSRTGMVSPMGTLTEVAKTHVDFETMQKFQAIVNKAGMNPSSALRDWIYLIVHKKTFTVLCVEAEKVKSEALFGEGPNQAQIGSDSFPPLQQGH